jgi:NADH-quinone oxidoreductase subunit G
MPSITFDDRPIPFEPGDTVIRAAHRAGVDVPHYCWHPGLSIAANCRMCLVEVMPPPGRPALMLDVLEWDADKSAYVPQKKPKLQPACQLGAADGMVIRSQSSPHVARARASVQELLLLNHPVDCPICDQAGECRLQDYWLEHQGTKKRMHDEPVHKPKAVVFGPTIVYDAERCILCTRCIRFCDEVAKDPVLSIRERGNAAWFAFYTLFVLAVSVHAPIGLRAVAAEWLGWRGPTRDLALAAFAGVLVWMGMRAVFAVFQ